MNKVISIVLSIIGLSIGVVVLMSILLTSEKSLKFLLNLNQDFSVDLNLVDSYWHPYKPSILIDTLSIETSMEGDQLLDIKELKIKFNLLSSFQGDLIDGLYSRDIDLFINASSKDSQLNINDLWFYLSTIKNLRIDKFTIKDSGNYLNSLEGELSSFTSESGSSQVSFATQNKNGGRLELRMHSIAGSSSLRDYKGFFTSSNFGLDKEIVSQLCIDCPGGTLDSKFWFTLIDLKLVQLSGDLKFQLNYNFDFIDSINASIELEDQRNAVFRISSFINDNPSNRIPEIFTSIADEELVFFIPTIELGKNRLSNKLQHLFNLPKDLILEGNINNLIFVPYDSLLLKANFKELSLKLDDLSISGLEGSFNSDQSISRLTIDTPYVHIDLDGLFDSPLTFNNLRSVLDVELIDKKISVSNSFFEGTYNQTLIKGNINLFPSPIDDSGDLSLKLSVGDLNYLEALKLFPNLTYIQTTKDWLQNSITCGALQEFSFIYRGPLDNEYNNSSLSFLSKGLFQDSCITINDTSIKNISLIANINNSTFLGEILDGDLYGSGVKGTIKTFKDNNFYSLDLKGDVKGPLTTLLSLSGLNQIFDTQEESGEHYTNFYFNSPLSSKLDILGQDSSLILKTAIKGGNFHNKATELYFSDLYSSIEYDSSNGVKDGFATIRINDIPVKFDIKKAIAKGNNSFSTLLVSEDFFSPTKLLTSFNAKNNVRGSSKFKVKLSFSSFIKGQSFIDPEIEVLSNLKGIEINLPEPFAKSKDSQINFRLAFTLPLKKPPLLSFKYGDLFRGKFEFLNNTTQGFVIAGKKKQSISIEDERVLLVGELQKLDLGSLISSGVFQEEGIGNFFIKDLFVQETNLSNLSLLETQYKSFRTKEGIEYKFINKDLTGILLVPEDSNRNLFFKFDFININQSADGSKDNFLSLYNSVNTEFDFSTKEIFLNGRNYGNWEFSILPESNRLTLYNIKGVYGKWGLRNNMEDKSSLEIRKSPIGWTSSLKTNIYSGSPEKAMLQIGIKPNFELDLISLDADLNWDNLPWLFDFNEISGEITTNLKGLTIINSEDLDSTNNILRLVNIFNITDSFEKVTNLDFRKLYKRGFTADSVTGRFKINKKSLEIEEPVLFKSGSSQFLWSGKISRDRKGNLDQLNLEVIMTLPLREYLPAYALVFGGPITAGIVYIAGKAFQKNLDKLSSGKWTIKGTASEPETEFNGWFEENTEK